MTTDPLARVAKLEKALRDLLAAYELHGDHPYCQLDTKEDVIEKAKSALTGTGDDVLADKRALAERAIVDAANAAHPRWTTDDIDKIIEALAHWGKLGAAPTDGWIEWKGGRAGQCPVDVIGRDEVWVRRRDGTVEKLSHIQFMMLCVWEQWQAPSDIIAYRLATPTEGR